MRRDLEREPRHLVGILRPGELVYGVKEDEERALLGGKLQQLLQVGCDRDCVIRNILPNRYIFILQINLIFRSFTSKGSISQ